MQVGRLNVSNNVLAFLIVVFVLLSSWGNWQLIRIQDITGSTSEGIGTISVCVNKPPIISYSCSLTAIVGSVYQCDIDAVQDTGENVTFYDYTDLFDINSSSGLIRFTPTSSQVGSYVMNITAIDNSGCSNNANSTIINMTVTDAYCGDGTCGQAEDCSSCASDCGVCPTVEEPAAAGRASGGGGGGVNIFDIDFSRVDEKIVTKFAGEKIVFTFNGITPHYAYVKRVESDYMVISIDKGEDITIAIKETRGIDMNGDGAIDVKFYYMSVDQNGKAQINGIKGEGAAAVANEDALPLKIDPESIKILLKVGTSFEQSLTIRNLASYDFNIILKQMGLEKFLEISETEFVVYSFGKKAVTLKFKAAIDQQPGVYTGKIFVEATPSPGRGGKIYKNVPVILEIESSDVLFDATLDIPVDYKEILPGQDVKGLITIFNLKKVRPVEIDVDYIIKDMYGNEVLREKDILSVEEQVSFEKKVRIPEDTKEGDYLFIVQTRYGSSFSTTSQKFYVGNAQATRIEETKKVIEEVQSKYNIALFAGIIFLFAVSIGMFVHYRKRIGKVERESKEKIVKRLEELEAKYRRDFEKAEEFVKGEEEEARLGLDKLADYIKEHIDKGFGKEQIRQHLRKHGWKDYHIDHAMHHASRKRLEEEMENLRRTLR